VGLGYRDVENAAMGVDPRARVGRLEEGLEVVERLWGGEPVSYQGKHFQLHEAFNHPPPAQTPRPPIWLGAKGGDRSLRLAARHADGWNTVWRWTPEAYADRVRRAREACDEEGRDPRSLRLSLGMYTVVGEDHDDLVARFRMLQSWMPGGALDRETLESFMSDTLTGTPDQVLERVARFAELGVEEVIVAPAPIPFALPDPSIVEVFAETVMPKAREL